MRQGLTSNLDKNTFKLEMQQMDNGRQQLVWQGFEGDKPVTYKKEPYTSFWQRFGIGLFRLLPIESQL